MEKITKFKSWVKKHRKKVVIVLTLVFFLFISCVKIFALPYGPITSTLGMSNRILTSFSIEINGDVISSPNILGNVGEDTLLPSFTLGGNEYNTFTDGLEYGLIADGPDDIQYLKGEYYMNNTYTDFVSRYNDFLIRRDDLKYISWVSLPIGVYSSTDFSQIVSYNIHYTFDAIFPYPDTTVRHTFDGDLFINTDDYNLGQTVYDMVRSWYVSYGFPENYKWEDIPTVYISNMELLYYDIVSVGELPPVNGSNNDIVYTDFVSDIGWTPTFNSSDVSYDVRGKCFQFLPTIAVNTNSWLMNAYSFDSSNSMEALKQIKYDSYGKLQYYRYVGQPNPSNVYLTNSNGWTAEYYRYIYFDQNSSLSRVALDELLNATNGTWGHFVGDVPTGNMFRLNLYSTPDVQYLSPQVQGYLSLYGDGDIIIRKTEIWDSISEFFEDTFGAFFDLRIFGTDLTLGAIVTIIVAVAVVSWVLKVFAGG